MSRIEPRILLAEDNDDHVELARIAFARCGRAVGLEVAGDGVACLAALESGAALPHLLLLDLDMPRLGGLEVLERIAGHERRDIRSLPVVVLSTSMNPVDVQRAYELRCSSYIVKPTEFAEFAATVRALVDYWFTAVALPPQRAGGPPALAE
jgi:CheY-like chemotaxis protein